MLKEISNNDREIIRYLRYNKVAIRVYTRDQYRMLLIRIPTIQYSMRYIPVLIKWSHYIDNPEDFEPFSFSLYSDHQPTRYNYIYINKLRAYDRIKQYTVLDIDELITCDKVRPVIKLPKIIQYGYDI